MRIKPLLGRLLLAASATAFVLLAVELGLRLFLGPPPPREDTLRTFTQYDPELGWKGREGASGPYRTRGFSTWVALTRDGWRDDERTAAGITTEQMDAGPTPDRTEADPRLEHPGASRTQESPDAGATPERPTKPWSHASGPDGKLPGGSGSDPSEVERAPPIGGGGQGPASPGAAPIRRVTLLGDSFAWGFGVNRGEMFADRLEALIPGLEVLNYGVSGYGTDQELLVLGRYIEADRPAVVVVEFAVENDLSNISGAESYGLPKPRFVLDEGVLRLEGIPVPRLGAWESTSRGSAAKEFLGAHFRLYTWATPRWAALRARIGRWTGGGGEDVVAMRRIRLLARDPGERVEQWWRLAEALLAAIRDRAARVGAPVVLLDVPDRIQVDDPLWEEAVAAFGLENSAYDRDQPERRLEAIGTRLGITVVPMLEQFRARQKAGESLYIAGDIHWNVKGHEVAATELARALRALVPADDRGRRRSADDRIH